MNRNISKIIVLITTIISINIQAQSKAGLVFVSEERWNSAEKEFAKSTAEEDVFYKGLSEYKLDEKDKAKASFNSIASKSWGKIGLGMLEYASNKDGAKKLFEEAAKETKNKNPEIFIAIARAIYHSDANHRDEASEWAKKAVEMSKNNADYRLAFGETCPPTEGGAAITSYEYAQTYAPTSAMPHAKIGQIYFRSRTYSIALENLNKALAMDPKNYMALNYLAQVYYKYKSYDTAIMYQNRILELGDKSPIDIDMLATMYFKKDDCNKALELSAELAKSDYKNASADRITGYCLHKTGKHADAIVALEKLISSLPKDKVRPLDYETLGNSYIANGDHAKGDEILKKMIDQNPNDKETLKSVAESFKKHKHFANAAIYYEKICALTDANKDDYNSLAANYYALKDWTKAEAAYTKVLELSPESVITYHNRGFVKTMIDPDQTTASAKSDYEKTLEFAVGKEEKFKKQIVKANIYLAKIAIKNENDKVKGKSHLDAALALDATNAEALELMKFVQ